MFSSISISLYFVTIYWRILNIHIKRNLSGHLDIKGVILMVWHFSEQHKNHEEIWLQTVFIEVKGRNFVLCLKVLNASFVQIFSIFSRIQLTEWNAAIRKLCNSKIDKLQFFVQHIVQSKLHISLYDNFRNFF